MFLRGLTFLVVLLWVLVPVLAFVEPSSSLGQWWFQQAPGSLNLTQAIVQRYVSASLWSDTIVPILQRPPWFAAFLLAMFAMLPWYLARLIRNMRASS